MADIGVKALRAFILLAACAGASEHQPDDAMDYAVYSAVLDQDSTDMSPAVRIHVVSRSTVVAPADVAEYYTPMMRKQVGDSLAPLVPELVRDLIARSATKVTLDSSRLVTRMPVVMLGPVVSPPTHDPRENWANFAKQYPGALGYVTLTRPGYDASRTHALLAFAHPCGPLCGTWGYYVVERRDKKWRLLQTVVHTVS